MVVAVVVDDIQATVFGKPQQVGRLADELTELLVPALALEGLPVSAPKTQPYRPKLQINGR